MANARGSRLIFRIFLLIFFAASGCSGRYSNVMTRYKEVPICCQSPNYFTYEELKPGDLKISDLDENSPAYQFDTGKSYFKAYSLPPYTGPYRISIQSYMNGQHIDTAHIFFPRLVFLNEKYEFLRATDALNFRLERADFSETWGLRFKLVGLIDVSEENRDEKYLIVMTTEELLQGRTSITIPKTVPIPLAGSMIPIPVGEKEVSVPNSPVGRIKIALMAGIPKDSEIPPGGEIPFSVPALSMDKKVGELQVGHTTLEQALKILPAFPDHPPAPRTGAPGPEIIGKTREVMEKVVLGYNPMWSPLILLFDKNNKLVLVARSFILDEKKEARTILERHRQQLKEVYKKSTTILQGEVHPCITLEIILNETGEPNPIAYMYTCPTS